MTTRDPMASGGLCMKRRDFLLASGASVATVLIATPGCTTPIWARRVRYPRKRIASLGDLQTDVPVGFRYPDEDPIMSSSVLVKLGVPAGGGIGAGRDIVAFNALCNHLGGPLQGTYKPAHKGLGPCPLHLTTFDLTRHGMVVAGHATESLPQILLEVEGDDIHATGIQGLLYGRAANVS